MRRNSVIDGSCAGTRYGVTRHSGATQLTKLVMSQNLFSAARQSGTLISCRGLKVGCGSKKRLGSTTIVAIELHIFRLVKPSTLKVQGSRYEVKSITKPMSEHSP